jgi:hypothetical protein
MQQKKAKKLLMAPFRCKEVERKEPMNLRGLRSKQASKSYRHQWYCTIMREGEVLAEARCSKK